MTVKIIAATVFGGIIGFIYPKYSSLVDPVISVFLLITMFLLVSNSAGTRNFSSILERVLPSSCTPYLSPWAVSLVRRLPD